MNDIIGYIYTLVDPITNLVKYVGQTTNPKERLKRHVANSRWKSIRAYWYGVSVWIRSLDGIEPIMTVIDKTSLCKLDDLEIYYIAHFDKGQLVNHIKSDFTTYRLSDTQKNKISKSLKIKQNGIKPVLQYDLEGNFIKEHSSTKRAMEELGTINIHLALTGRKPSIAGFMWKYKTSDDYPLKIEKYDGSGIRRKVLQYDLEGNFIKEYNSIAEAIRLTKIKTTLVSVSFCCQGKYKSAGGFIWKYKTSDNCQMKIERYDGKTKNGKNTINPEISIPT